MPPRAEVRVLQHGDITKPNPFTICIIANPALETPWRSGEFVTDPITEDPARFNQSVRSIVQGLFGRAPGRAERFLGDPTVEPRIRVVTLLVQDLRADDATALVSEDAASDLLIARRTAFIPFLARYDLFADVAYAVSHSLSHRRASAWPTSDDDTRAGVPFRLDGDSLTHRFYNRIPGTVALHATSGPVTALHEFGHALSSYTNGQVVDLYVDGGPAVNKKVGRPIPSRFAVYEGIELASDRRRDGLGYPAAWQSYHCELHDRRYPALMDDYWRAYDGAPEHAQHDRITRRFLLDRVRAKLER
jgi:hypothetical protein